MKRKLYIVSGLGADDKVLNKIDFGDTVEPVFIPWLIPSKNETMAHYCKRMALPITQEQPFYLLGYSFGGMVVQEIHKKMPAEKVFLLGCIKGNEKQSLLFRFAKFTRIYKLIPTSFFTHDSMVSYFFFRQLYSKRVPKLLDYFTCRDPYYLRWSMDKVLHWKGIAEENIIQILAENDAVFPIKYSTPQHIIPQASHLFPVTKSGTVSKILQQYLK